jgi:ATP-dependent Clp protease, protease subunit
MNPFFSFLQNTSGPVELYLYDEIGLFGNNGAQDFAKALAVYKDNDLKVRINSPGGDVFTGLTMFSLLREHPKNVICQIDGLAASIASVIALAGKEVIASENAMLMLHDPSGTCEGTATDMIQFGGTLSKIGDVLTNIYATKSKQSPAVIRAIMSQEKWFTATEAQEFGLVDKITPELKMAARFDFSRFKNPPKALLEISDLKKENSALKATVENHRKERISSIVDSAIQDGRLPLANREKWIARALADEPGTVAEIQAMQPVLNAASPHPKNPQRQNDTLDSKVQNHLSKLNKLRN